MRIKLDSVVVNVDNQCDVISCIKDISNEWAKSKNYRLVSLQADTNVSFKITYAKGLEYNFILLYLEDETIDKIIKEPALEAQSAIDNLEQIEPKRKGRPKRV